MILRYNVSIYFQIVESPVAPVLTKLFHSNDIDNDDDIVRCDSYDLFRGQPEGLAIHLTDALRCVQRLTLHGDRTILIAREFNRTPVHIQITKQTKNSNY